MENLPTGRYAGVAFKQHHGEDAKQLISRARVLVNRARMKIRNRGGKGQQLESEVLPDGSVIRCLVIHNLAVPIVRWWIERPEGGGEERSYEPTHYLLPFILGTGFVFGDRPLKGEMMGWAVEEGAPTYTFIDDWVGYEYSDALGWTETQVFARGELVYEYGGEGTIAAVARQKDYKQFLQLATYSENKKTVKIYHVHRGTLYPKLTFTSPAIQPIRHCSFSPDASRFAIYIPYNCDPADPSGSQDEGDKLYVSEFTLEEPVFDEQGVFQGGGSYSAPTLEKEGTLPTRFDQLPQNFDENWEAVYSYKWEDANTLTPISVAFRFYYHMTTIDEPVYNPFAPGPLNPLVTGNWEICHHIIVTWEVGTEWGPLMAWQTHDATPNKIYGTLYTAFPEYTNYETLPIRHIPLYGKAQCMMVGFSGPVDDKPYLIDENGNRALVDQNGLLGGQELALPDDDDDSNERSETHQTRARPEGPPLEGPRSRVSVDGVHWAEVPYRLRPFLYEEEGPPYQVTFWKIYHHVFWPRDVLALKWKAPVGDIAQRCMYVKPTHNEFEREANPNWLSTYPDDQNPQFLLNPTEGTEGFWFSDVRDMTDKMQFIGQTTAIRQRVPFDKLTKEPDYIL